MKGFYINLEKRKDRKEKMEQLKQKNLFFQKIQRFNAVSNDNGKIGCYLSHIQCLEKCLHLQDEYFLIMEDDFSISNNSYYKEFLNDFPILQKNKDWDIFLFTNSIIRDNSLKPFLKHFNRVFNFQTTTGYIIRKSFIPTLLKHFKEGLQLYLKTKKEIYCIDIHWKILQKTHNFISYHKQFVIQYPSYSDIEKKDVNYFRIKSR